MKRIIFKGTIKIEGPFHLGSGEINTDSDNPIILDLNRNPIIPGTSWSGTFRSYLEAGGWDPAGTTRLFGQPGQGDNGHISRIRFQTSRLTSDQILKNTRQGVGIDRPFSAAKEQILYDWEALSPGRLFPFYAFFDQGDLTDEDFQESFSLLALLFQAVQEGFIALGGKNTTGHGLLKLNTIQVHEADFSRLKILANFLARTTVDWIPPGDEIPIEQFINIHLPKFRCPAANELMIRSRRRLRVKYFLEVRDFLLVRKGGKDIFDKNWSRRKAGINAPEDTLDKDIDGVFQTYNNGKGYDQAYNQAYNQANFLRRMILPGSSFKGVLRSRGEKILRTLGGGLACSPFDPTNCGRLKKVELCRACEMFGCTTWQGRLTVHDLKPKDIRLKLLDHVALDRFHGGSSEGGFSGIDQDVDRVRPSGGKKYDAWVAASGSFEGTLELTGFEDWMPGLLGLLFKDLFLEDIRVGYGTRRGYGGIQGVVKEIMLWTDSNDPFWKEPPTETIEYTKNNPWSGLNRTGLIFKSSRNPASGSFYYESPSRDAPEVGWLDEKIKLIWETSPKDLQAGKARERTE